MFINDLMNRIWYEDHPGSYFLMPFSWLYGLCVNLRSHLYSCGFFTINYVAVPVIVVGNITVGGTGKTPLVIWLCEYLVKRGFRPGIISRGYGRRGNVKIQQVRADSDPQSVGDEPVLIARRTGRPVAVSSDRYEAAMQLLEHTDCNLMICDDGLQDLALGRNMEIAVIDGDRLFGNNRLLPAGPLREPVNRLAAVDMSVSNGRAYKNNYLMEYEYGDVISLTDESKKLPVSHFSNGTIHAVSGIANPDRFYSYLRSQDINLIKHVFPDHYIYKAEDIVFTDDHPVVMTEKDAVKCTRFAKENMWYLPVNAKLNDVFHHRMNSLISENINGQETA